MKALMLAVLEKLFYAYCMPYFMRIVCLFTAQIVTCWATDMWCFNKIVLAEHILEKITIRKHWFSVLTFTFNYSIACQCEGIKCTKCLVTVEFIGTIQINLSVYLSMYCAISLKCVIVTNCRWWLQDMLILMVMWGALVKLEFTYSIC